MKGHPGLRWFLRRDPTLGFVVVVEDPITTRGYLAPVRSRREARAMLPVLAARVERIDRIPVYERRYSPAEADGRA